jgi:hypothetical protein
MAARTPLCAGDVASALTSMRQINFDAVAIGHAAAGVFFGVFGVRLVPMLLLLLVWEAGEYLIACSSVLEPLQNVLRPSLGDVAFVLGGWTIGRLFRLIDRRRSERRLIAEGQAASEAAWLRERTAARYEITTPVAHDYPASYGAEIYPSAPDYPAPEETVVDPATMLELDDHEARALRGALKARLAELRRQGADRANASGDSWSAIGTLESLLSRLPA